MLENTVKLKELSPQISELVNSDHALVHMIESVMEFHDKNSLLHNAIRIINGEAIEYTDTSNNYEKDSLGSGLKGISCSSIKQGYPLRLFDLFSSVGMLIDGNNVDYAFSSGNIVYNGNGTVPNSVSIMESHPFKELADAEKVTGIYMSESKRKKCISLSSSEQKNYFWKAYIKKFFECLDNSRVHGYQDYYDASHNADSNVPMVTETIINLKGLEKIKAVIYSKPADELDIKTLKFYPEHNDGKSFLYSVMLKGMLKEYGVDVPIIYYEKTPLNKLKPYEDIKKVPLIKEVDIKAMRCEIIKAAAWSNQSFVSLIAKYCSHALGEDLTKDPDVARRLGTSNNQALQHG